MEHPDHIKALKTQAAQRAVELIEDGMLIGLGSGSTSEIALDLIAQKIKEGMQISGIPSSQKVARIATDLGIPLLSFADVDQLDLNIDGADEVDPNLQLIKGGGGALLREKINAYNARLNIIMVDERKIVPYLGAFPLPLEINPFGHEQSMRILQKEFNIKCQFRKANAKLFNSDNGNYILDCFFEKIENPAALDQQLQAIPGVLETGLFINIADQVIVARPSGIEVLVK